MGANDNSFDYFNYSRDTGEVNAVRMRNYQAAVVGATKAAKNTPKIPANVTPRTVTVMPDPRIVQPSSSPFKVVVPNASLPIFNNPKPVAIPVNKNGQQTMVIPIQRTGEVTIPLKQ